MSPRYKLSRHLGAAVKSNQVFLYPVHVVVNLVATTITIGVILGVLAATTVWSVWTIFRGQPSFIVKFWKY